MHVQRLVLDDVRGFKHIELNFQEGMNLLVGINGVGKSTILDSLRIVLGKLLPQLNASIKRGDVFTTDDIRVGQQALNVQMTVAIGDIPVLCALNYSKRLGMNIRPEIATIKRHLKGTEESLLAVYCSPRRSVPSDQPSRSQNSTSKAGLKHRSMLIRDFAQWWEAQVHLALEDAHIQQRIDQLRTVLLTFLAAYNDVRVERITKRQTPIATLKLKKNDTWLDVRQLSDGERGMIALVLDIARRLSDENRELEDPLRDGKAIILIDELDLHLHPRWQRTIVQQLTTTFRKCQFIATTHSPQIIGEVAPENIIIIEDGEVLQPPQSFGMDSNWVLQNIMDTSERDDVEKQHLETIDELIEEGEFAQAQAEIQDVLAKHSGDSPELIRLQTRLLRMKLLGK